MGSKAGQHGPKNQQDQAPSRFDLHDTEARCDRMTALMLGLSITEAESPGEAISALLETVAIVATVLSDVTDYEKVMEGAALLQSILVEKIELAHEYRDAYLDWAKEIARTLHEFKASPAPASSEVH